MTEKEGSHWLSVIGATLIILPASLVLLTSLAGWNWLRPYLHRYSKQHWPVTIAIQGDLDIRWLPHVRLTATTVGVAVSGVNAQPSPADAVVNKIAMSLPWQTIWRLAWDSGTVKSPEAVPTASKPVSLQASGITLSPQYTAYIPSHALPTADITSNVYISADSLYIDRLQVQLGRARYDGSLKIQTTTPKVQVTGDIRNMPADWVAPFLQQQVGLKTTTPLFAGNLALELNLESESLVPATWFSQLDGTIRATLNNGSFSPSATKESDLSWRLNPHTQTWFDARPQVRIHCSVAETKFQSGVGTVRALLATDAGIAVLGGTLSVSDRYTQAKLFKVHRAKHIAGQPIQVRGENMAMAPRMAIQGPWDALEFQLGEDVPDPDLLDQATAQLVTPGAPFQTWLLAKEGHTYGSCSAMTKLTLQYAQTQTSHTEKL